MKGVILAGGTGQRLYPLTKITNKHLLPVYDRPMICYAVEALSKIGIEDILIVTGGFYVGEFIRLLKDGGEYNVNLSYAYQERPGGIAEALGLARKFAGDSKIAVILGDNVFEYTLNKARDIFLEQISGAHVVLSQVDSVEHLRNVGVAEFRAADFLDLKFDIRVIVDIVEKPMEPPSNMAVAGAYFYDTSVFDIINELKPSARGELEITDVNRRYVKAGQMGTTIQDGYWGDFGESIEDYYRVNSLVMTLGANKER